MQYYVCGFMFNENMTQVALIRKIKPDWMKGKLNGIGGKIEDGETEKEAMAREFQEETGVTTLSEEWIKFATLESNSSFVNFFYTCSVELYEVRTVEEEIVDYFYISNLMREIHEALPNVLWLIQMARSWRKGETCNHFVIREMPNI